MSQLIFSYKNNEPVLDESEIKNVEKKYACAVLMKPYYKHRYILNLTENSDDAVYDISISLPSDLSLPSRDISKICKFWLKLDDCEKEISYDNLINFFTETRPLITDLDYTSVSIVVSTGMVLGEHGLLFSYSNVELDRECKPYLMSRGVIYETPTNQIRIAHGMAGFRFADRPLYQDPRSKYNLPGDDVHRFGLGTSTDLDYISLSVDKLTLARQNIGKDKEVEITGKHAIFNIRPNFANKEKYTYYLNIGGIKTRMTYKDLRYFTINRPLILDRTRYQRVFFGVEDDESPQQLIFYVVSGTLDKTSQIDTSIEYVTPNNTLIIHPHGLTGIVYSEEPF